MNMKNLAVDISNRAWALGVSIEHLRNGADANGVADNLEIQRGWLLDIADAIVSGQQENEA